MIYVVTWVFTTIVSVPCPDFKPDAYGRWSQTHCAVFHGQRVDTPMKKEIATKEEAEKFVAEAPIQSELEKLMNRGAHDFKIEQVEPSK